MRRVYPGSTRRAELPSTTSLTARDKTRVNPPRYRVVCPECGRGTWNTHFEKHKASLDCQVGSRKKGLLAKGLAPVGRFFQTLQAAGIKMEKFATESFREYNGKKYQDVESTRYWAPNWAVVACWVWNRKWGQGSNMGHGPKKGQNRELYKQLKWLASTPEAHEAFLYEAQLFWKVTV